MEESVCHACQALLCLHRALDTAALCWVPPEPTEERGLGPWAGQLVVFGRQAQPVQRGAVGPVAKHSKGRSNRAHGNQAG